MTPEQREQLDAIEARGHLPRDGWDMVRTMRRIDKRAAAKLVVLSHAARIRARADKPYKPSQAENALLCACIVATIAAALFMAVS